MCSNSYLTKPVHHRHKRETNPTIRNQHTSYPSTSPIVKFTSMAARNPLQSLFAGGQLPEESVPVAMARAVVGVPHDIEMDVEEEDRKIS